MTNFPPPDFIRTTSAVPGIDVYMPRPPAETHQEMVDFHCPQCDGVTAYSAENGGLTCTFCGYYEPPRQKTVGTEAKAFEFTVETMDRAPQGWGVGGLAFLPLLLAWLMNHQQKPLTFNDKRKIQ
ncbi:MAG: hypothetical protein IPF56_00695 [Chloroflexi bacterium]|nr:hypothetical protein [Chloroflexota bacterium]MBK6710676.1 hypothetical protein [Chloroflexota bacterium]MBK7917402.1 hypothetical protein [Chloroflexota bacterium]MBK8933191.1 hypothetical protein [Chloroflexota bacterium]MBP7593019.1 hypothetical protein [Chloroflexota bacterium]